MMKPRLRTLLLLLVALDFLDPVHGLLTANTAAAQSTPPIPTFNAAQLQIPATGADFNTLVQKINAILVPLIPAAPGAVNLISLTGGVTGSPGVIGLQLGADANAGIFINPNGSGNIILFGPGDTGVLQFGNAADFVPATGFASCPGVIPNRAPIGVGGTVSSYVIVKDWLGNSHGWATC